MITFQNMSVSVPFSFEKVENEIRKKLRRIKGIDSVTECLNFDTLKIIRKSLDSRKGQEIHYVVSAALSLDEKAERLLLQKVKDGSVTETKINCFEYPYDFSDKQISEEERPVIIGAGPAGYFAALVLARAGAKPIVFERGKKVEERSLDVEGFWNGEKELLAESNVSFGEGGAGTFSDGKLFTGNKDKYGQIRYMLEAFHKFGAPESILYEAKPHIGTDVLKTVMMNMRHEIEELGGEVCFSARLDDIEPLSKDEGYKLRFTKVEEGSLFERNAKCIILAIGHSARDTFRMLYKRKYTMEQKPFAVGLRVEHPRKWIDHSQYKTDQYDDILPAADYKLTYHAKNGRDVFSFCMCPGGYVVNASSDPESMVVNGMSYSDRAGMNSNSALVVGVSPMDYPGVEPMDAINFQEELEKRFYEAGNRGSIPVQRYADFKEGRKTEKLGKITPAIKGNYVLSDISKCFPADLQEAILEAMPDFGRKIKGFDHPDTVFSGVESRTSSPVRIVREADYMASGFPGVYPCGEGAGYAGGITSAAVDGIRTAVCLGEYLLKNHD